MTTQRIAAVAFLSLLFAWSAAAQLDSRCTVSVLNRTAQVTASGIWVVRNVPSNLGRVRARATCVQNGVTRVGQSDFFDVPRNGVVVVPEIVFNAPVPVPARMTLTAPNAVIQVGDALQLGAVVTDPDGTTRDVTSPADGTSYTTSSTAVATISSSGLVTATGSGVAILSAINEGALGLTRITVAGADDLDADGMPNDFETENGLNPNDPSDANGDLDADGLTNVAEYQLGTGLRTADTDGDGIRDGLEVQTGTDPLNPQNFDLARALRRMEVTPASVTLRTNPLLGEASAFLRVTGVLLDGFTLDLTSTSRGTSYSSSDPLVCNFGTTDGQIFAGNAGSAVVTVSSNGYNMTVPVFVTAFEPAGLASITIPGYANNVEVAGGYAFVAAGSAGLQVVDVSDPANPVLAGDVALPGTAADVRLRGNYAYVAVVGSGVHVVDISVPASPQLVGSVAVPGDAQDLVVDAGYAYVATGSSGLSIVDITQPATPTLVGSLDVITDTKGVAVNGNVAVLVGDPQRAAFVDVTNRSAPVLLATAFVQGQPKDVVVRGPIAFVAAYTGGLQILDFTNPASVVELGSLPTQFVPRDVAVIASLAIFAEQLFPNAIPFVDVADPANPAFRDIIDLSPLGDYAGTGIDADTQYVYITAESFVVSQDFEADGDTRLFIAHWQSVNDTNGIPPTVEIVAPPEGSTVVAGSSLTIDLDVRDDVALEVVELRVDGMVVSAALQDPYEIGYTVPGTGTSSLVIEVLARDFGGNVTTAARSVVVIPDPLTTVRGVVREDSGSIVQGATVILGDRTTTTDESGVYLFSGVPTIADISVSAFKLAGLDDWRGVAGPLTPVRGGITAADITLARVPGRILSSLPLNGSIADVAVRGRLAAVAAYDAGVHLVDFTDVLNPVLVRSIPFYASGVRWNGPMLAIISQGGVALYDVSDPAQVPEQLSILWASDATDVAFHGTTAYVGTRYDLSVFSVDDPRNTYQIGSNISFERGVGTIGMSGNFAVMTDLSEESSSNPYGGGADSRSVVYIVDVSDRDDLAILGSVSMPGVAKAIAAGGTRAYAANGEHGVQVIDFSTPSAPVVADELQNDFLAYDIALRGDYITVVGDAQYADDLAMVADVRTGDLAPMSGVDFAAPGFITYGVGLTDSFAAAGGHSQESGSRLFILNVPANTEAQGAAPIVAISDPADGAQVIEGSLVAVTVTAQDDQRLQSVTLALDGFTIESRTTAPFTTSVRIPPGRPTLTLRAEATDFGGRSATAVITLAAGPDPLTSVTGTVQTATGVAVANAKVSLDGYGEAYTDETGAYLFEGVPTIRGDLTLRTVTEVAGSWQSATSAPVAPFAGGVTNVPPLVLQPMPLGLLFSGSAGNWAPSIALWDGNRAAVATGWLVNLYDYSDPTSPYVAYSIFGDGYATEIARDGAFLYAFGSGQLQILDPDGPEPVRGTMYIGDGNTMAVASGSAYVLGSERLSVVDGTNPDAPSVVGTLALTDATKIAVRGSSAVVLSQVPGQPAVAHILSIADPSQPAIVSSVTFPVSNTADVVVLGDGVAYVSLQDDGIRTISLANPSAPEILAPFAPSATALTMRGAVLAAAASGQPLELRIFDTTAPLSPQFVRAIPLSPSACVPTSMALSDELAFVLADLGFLDSGVANLHIAKYRDVSGSPAMRKTPGAR